MVKEGFQEKINTREIKYRIYLDGRFYYWGFIDSGFYNPVVCAGKMSIKEAKEHSQQYIGRKDRNGVEIYDGDIVNSSECGVGQILWAKTGFYWQQKPYKHHEFLSGPQEFDNLGENLEVIGNIYENPELKA